MDVWVYLTNGNVAPLTGVSAIAEVKDYDTDVSVPLSGVAWEEGDVSIITVADTTGVLPGMRIQVESRTPRRSSLPQGTRVHSVASSTEIVIEPPFTNPVNAYVNGTGAAIADPESYVESGYYRDPADDTADGVSGATIPPRQLRYRENLWKFTCEVDGTTLDMKFRKSQVIGWSNSEPQF